MGKKRPPQSAPEDGGRKRRKGEQGASGANAEDIDQERARAKGRGDGFRFTPRPEWHTAELSALPIPEKASSPPQATIGALKQHGQKLLEQENTKYSETHLKSSSSHKFLSTIMSSGTLDDKVSALTLLVQESPVHTMKAFENLVGLAGKSSRNQALLALQALRDLLGQGVVLPPDRKLRYFDKQPGLLSLPQGKAGLWREGQSLPGSLQEAHLISWAFEDWLKRKYFDLLKTLERWCNDEIEYARNRAVTYVWELLKEKPEQEENLLRLLINKLGDNEKKVASRASYLLLQLQVTHPVMKTVIVNAIESECLFRPGQTAHAKYYAVITLNQTVLSMREQEVANKLLRVYFALFLSLLKTTAPSSGPEINAAGKVQGGGGKPGRKARQKEKLQEKALETEAELYDKVIAQILTGVNRAYPFAETGSADFTQHVDTLFRVAHSTNFNTAVQAMMLIQQISASKHHSADRFYRMLYESLLDVRLLASSKQILYLNLLYRALKADVSIKRVKAFVKRLLQIITLHEPPFACGVLYLVYELQQSFPSIDGMFRQPEEAADEQETFKDADNVNDDSVQNDITTANGTAYDPRKRDPEHSNASLTCLWDILPLTAHFHPSVSLFATALLHQQKMPAKPDPSIYTPMHFLDRFVYRNAKTKTDIARGSSIMQPLASNNAADLLIKKRDGSKLETPMNSELSWQRKLEDVGADEVFFHQYFQQEKERQSKRQRKAEKKGRKGGDEEDDDEDESFGEGEVWKAITKSNADLAGAEDENGSFSDMDDLDEEEEEDLAELDAAMRSDNEGEDDTEAVANEQTAGSDDDGFDAADLDDNEALLGSDEEIAFDVPDDTGEREGRELSKSQKKRKERKKLKQLPVFASVDNYAKLLEGDDDE